ncbi:phosphotransferase [Azoarcus indigens]|nr:phosphotransferase [Azoarcus indigens]
MEDLLPAIAEALHQAGGKAVQLASARPAGGSTPALDVQGKGVRYFVKLADITVAERLDAEAEGLAALAATGAFRVPDVLAQGRVGDQAFLVLEHLSLHRVSSAKEGERFAQALSALHATTGERYGWHRSNYLGPTRQFNDRQDNWVIFLSRHRLAPLLTLAGKAGYIQEIERPGLRLLERLPALFLDYRPAPSLLHGDLWHGNAAMTEDGTPTLFDPACHYGDREADLAMAELFGGFPSAFYAAYRRLAPLSADYEVRKLVYQLHHLLNHLHIFGRTYAGQVQRLLAQLLRELS